MTNVSTTKKLTTIVRSPCVDTACFGPDDSPPVDRNNQLRAARHPVRSPKRGIRDIRDFMAVLLSLFIVFVAPKRHCAALLLQTGTMIAQTRSAQLTRSARDDEDGGALVRVVVYCYGRGSDGDEVDNDSYNVF